MGIFSRTKDVQNTDLDRLFLGTDDPLKTARLIIHEMEDVLVEVRSTAVRTLARKKEIERGLADLQTEADEWQSKAALALSKDREELARGALAVRFRLQSEHAELAKLLPSAEAELAAIERDLSELRIKLTEARNRQRILQLRSESASARKKAKGTLNSLRPDTALEQLASHVDHLDAEAEAYDLGKKSLQAQFDNLQQTQAVDDALLLLKNQLHSIKNNGT